MKAPATDRRPPATARSLAFDVLLRAAQSTGFAADLFDQELERQPLSPADRRLATELVYGVVRRTASLDAVLETFITRSLDKVEHGLRVLLRLGAYQLIFLDSIPQHAAVNETIALAGRNGPPRWTGFANGVLRSVARSVQTELGAAVAANAVPLAPGRFRQLDRRVFPNPELDPAGYIASAFSFPHWLIDRWKSRFDFRELERLACWFNMPPRICLRFNLLPASGSQPADPGAGAPGAPRDRVEYLRILEEAGIASHAGQHPQAVWLEQGARIEELPGYSAGWFSVQDESAMHAASLLAPRSGERVLDLCAAPGGKTSHLAELMQNRGSILAVDVAVDRLRLVDGNCRRLGISIVTTELVDRDLHDLPAGPFDAILLDVPCSNTGVLGKRPEARWRLRPAELAELTELQRLLLRSAMARLAPGGRLVYSTCSIEPDENDGVVESIVKEQSGWEIADRRRHIPGEPADGGFQALLVRSRT